MIVVLMGVSGSGKTTIGELLGTLTGWTFEDGDNYHSAANKQKMAEGVPLTDEDRLPWLATLNQLLQNYHHAGKSAILACSALKKIYRHELTKGFAPSEMQFIYLHAPEALIAERLRLRKHEYMNSHLLGSQLATLEAPKSDEAWSVIVNGTPQDSANSILQRLHEEGKIS